MNKIYTCLILCFILNTVSFAQSDGSSEYSNNSLHATVGYNFGDKSEISLPGLDYQHNFLINDRIGMQFRIGFNRWNDADRFSLPGLLGINYGLGSMGSYDLQLLLNGGASLEVGNDYGSVFAAVESGLQMMPKTSKRIGFSLSWVQHMAFHPDHYSFIRFRLGYFL